MPKDRVSGAHQSYGFVEYMSEDDADYAIKIMQMIKLYGKPIKVNKVKYIVEDVLLTCMWFISDVYPGIVHSKWWCQE